MNAAPLKAGLNGSAAAVPPRWQLPPSFDTLCRNRLRQNTSLGPWQDKIKVKRLVDGIAPGLVVAKVLFVAGRASQITAAVLGRLPANYVVKANHGSQMTVLGKRRQHLAGCVTPTVRSRCDCLNSS